MKKLLALLMAAAMVMCLAACGSSSSSTSSAGGDTTVTEPGPVETEAPDTTEVEPGPVETEAPDTTEVEPGPAEVEEVTLNVAYMPNYASLWAVLSGIHMGYFAEEGITVNLISFEDGASEIAAMEGGSVDLAYIGKGAHRLCIIGSAVIFAPSSVHSTYDMICAEGSGIESVYDLAGKTVAYAGGSSSETAMQAALSLAGLTMDDITPAALDINYITSAMASGSVDVAFTWNPYTDQILENVEGTYKVDFSDGATNMSSWIVLPDYYEANREVLVRFERALLKAMTYGANSDNYEEVAQWVAEQTATDYDACFGQTGDAYWFTAADVEADLASGELEAYYERVMDDFLGAGTIEESEVRDVSEWVLLDVLQEAVDTM